MARTLETEADRDTHGRDMPGQDTPGDDLDMHALAAAIRRKRSWIVLATLAGLLIAGAVIAFVKPRYTAQAQVLLENQENFLTRPERTEVPRELTSGPDPESVASQVELVSSRDLGRRVIAAMHLVGNPEFDPLAKGLGSISRLLVVSGLMRDPLRIAPEERALDAYIDHLTVFSPPKTRVVTIAFRSTNPDLAAKVANEVAVLYLETQSEAKRNAAKAAAASLAAEIADLRVKVAHAEDEVEKFRAGNGLLAGTNNMTIVGQQLAELNTELSHARTTEADAQAKASLIRDMLRQGRIGDVADVANNDLVRRIAEQRVLAKSQLALESRALLPGHPRIKELTAQIAALESELRAAADKTARTLENDSKIALARVANLETAIDQQKKNVTLANVDDVHLRGLERIAQGYRAQLESSMTKYQEATGRENSPATPADARIIARADVPQEPTFPRKLPTLLFGAIAGFILSLAVAVSSELLGSRGTRRDRAPPEPSGPNDGRKEPEAPAARRALAQLPPPAAKPAENRAADAVAQAQRSDDDNAAGRNEAATGVVVDAPHPASRRIWALPPRVEGKGLRIVATALADDVTATARIVEFARNLAHEGRPIIVDLDQQSTRLAALFGAHPPARLGLSDLGDDRASFAEIIHRDHASRLHFVLAGTTADFHAEDLDLLLDALLQTYDFLVIAAPALETSGLVKALAAHADVVALAAPGEPVEAALAAAAEALHAAGAGEVVVLDGRLSVAPAEMRNVA